MEIFIECFDNVQCGEPIEVAKLQAKLKQRENELVSQVSFNKGSSEENTNNMQSYEKDLRFVKNARKSILVVFEIGPDMY